MILHTQYPSEIHFHRSTILNFRETATEYLSLLKTLRHGWIVHRRRGLKFAFLPKIWRLWSHLAFSYQQQEEPLDQPQPAWSPDLCRTGQVQHDGWLKQLSKMKKREVRLHSLLLHSTYLSHNAEAAFSPVSHSWMAGHCESGRVRHALIWRLTHEAWTKTHHQTPKERLQVDMCCQLTLLLKVRKESYRFPHTVVSKWFSSPGTSSLPAKQTSQGIQMKNNSQAKKRFFLFSASLLPE